jgi:hypothetical protein
MYKPGQPEFEPLSISNHIQIDREIAAKVIGINIQKTTMVGSYQEASSTASFSLLTQ